MSAAQAQPALAQPMPVPEFMSRRQLSAYLRSRGIPMAVATLTNNAYTGSGPPMVRFVDGGHPRYERAAVDRWIEARKATPSVEARVYMIDRHSGFGRQLQLLGWRNQMLPSGGWETVKLNLAGRPIARQGDAAWDRDFRIAEERNRSG